MAVIVRAATVEDGGGMLALMPRLAAFPVPTTRDPEHLWRHDAALLERWLAEQREDCRVHVAVEDGAIVGLAMVSLRPELLSREPSAHLEAIAVAPGYEGAGVGGSLLAAAEQDAIREGALSMTLHVFAANERARRFYDKCGYEGELMRCIKHLEPEVTTSE
jgi:ribosomal protein S18 acetylase RimI-like enzyme